MTFFRAGVALGAEVFLIVDMAIIHELLRLHGVLFSNYFEYAVLSISLVLAANSVLTRKWSFQDRFLRNGILTGLGGTTFLDVVIVDQMLKLHTVNYPSAINIGSGIIGLIVMAVGIYRWRALKKQRLPE